MNSSLKPQKIAIAVAFLVFMALGTSLALLSVSGRMLSGKTGVTPSMSLPINVVKYSQNKKIKGFGILALIVSFGLPVLLFGGVGIAVFLPKHRELHGSAKLASTADLRKSGLLQPDKNDDKYPSLVVGKAGKQFLLFRGQQFMFLSAPTRSGKGVGIVIPNLLHYRDSVVVLDVKEENYKVTAGFRAACGQEVYRFAPDDEKFKTDCWNPLDYVRHDPMLRIKDLMSITNILYPPSDDVWNSTAESLFLGLALYILDTAKERDNLNIATIKKYKTSLSFLADEKTFLAYVESRKSYEPLSADCIQHLLAYAKTVEKMRSSIDISFDKPLGIFSDPITAQATSKSTFDLRDVRKRRMSIYVVIRPANIDKFGQFLNLFFQQLLVLNMDELPEENPELKYQCLLLLDEFPAMGRVAIIEKACAYMAGYNMRLLLIFQSKSQVEDRKLYDKTGAQTMLTNMALQVCYAPRDDQDAKDYSEMIGYMTEKSTSKSRQLGLSKNGGQSESESDQRRAVLLPQEVKAIGIEKEIISLENMVPALVDKIRWYKEPVFMRRANMPLPPAPDQSSTEQPENTIEPDVSETLHFSGAIRDQSLGSGVSFEVGFSPRRNALEAVMSLILSAQHELYVAAYSLTSRPIALALGEAKARGVDVRIVVDRAQNNDDQTDYKAVDFLVSKNVPVIKCANYTAMHHKFMVADKKHVQLGSFNYTSSADNRNAETAIVLRNTPELAEVYRTEWLRLTSEPPVTPEQIMAVDKGLAVLRKFRI
ncbi:MAG: type IV secretory system conjugative DNA transfer family protein [Azoarcus sp.]|jgi:type IV secretion system protein VirD4|nr:type IV secretory system conjugative DNA transfer family protein [Azoarcus sp.]